MADMFSRLADRAVGSGTITPRTPTRFEGETSLEAEETATATPTPANVDSAPRFGQSVAVVEAPKAGGLEASTSIPAAQVRPMPTPVPAPTSMPMSAPAPVQPRVAEPSETTTPSRRATFKALVSQTPEESRVRPAPEPVVNSFTTSIVESRSVETRETRRAGPTTASAAAPAPRPVHITIGRIEVRAMPAAAQQQAAPAPQAPAEPQGLTLSQYLRGDDGRPS